MAVLDDNRDGTDWARSRQTNLSMINLPQKAMCTPTKSSQYNALNDRISKSGTPSEDDKNDLHDH